MVEIGTHSAIERADVVTLDLRVSATQFYPNQTSRSLCRNAAQSLPSDQMETIDGDEVLNPSFMNSP